MCSSTVRKIPCATRAASGECSQQAGLTGSLRCLFVHACLHLWLAGRQAGWQAGWLAGWQAGWLAGSAAPRPSVPGPPPQHTHPPAVPLLGPRIPLPCCRRAVPVAPGAKGSPAVIPVALEELAAFSSLRIYIPQDLRTPVGAGSSVYWAVSVGAAAARCSAASLLPAPFPQNLRTPVGARMWGGSCFATRLPSTLWETPLDRPCQSLPLPRLPACSACPYLPAGGA